MTDLRQRLLTCFVAVFPDLSENEIPLASTATVSAWDSLASVTLVSVIEEEFDLQLDVDELEDLNSFALVLAVLNERASKAT